MLEPKKLKYRKQHRNRGSLKGVALRCNKVAYGQFGLKAMEKKEITARQLEAARKAAVRYIKRGGKMWIRIFPHKPITKKSAEVPMGSGKGAVEYYAAPVKPGTIIFEMDGIEPETAKEALRLASHKLPLQCKFIDKKTL
ncbi:50S ribosomal protein L16 [Candidatus Peregrinibacteria bacterium RIFOXYC2_FULL_33_13]|nr:MAG: 50S ribosomal protein L16 [Candidatus Peregrinibacteria bacterium GW2011_GWA2_33_10]KKP40748.1 MAG: 50S ribosomal protein L16, large subunit ribosomal protein L16 [Candidatus Peregrinibacteria bacterium GW2011_GWC2_33_13]OGJ51107.1 MAG: 50S ribosomal protein L16 [Candidatus Peregrinibacteria bacterium RIFOXYA2_FULL_33_7]OGJ55449.1 MAG: 50S ribosomal protein L16 [Candidatus Peregrinibacteria bacterium RIFOXYC2_FULL_33_13]